MKRRALPIRVWFGLLMAVFIVVPALAVAAVAAVSPPLEPTIPLASMAAQIDPGLARTVTDDIERWADPGWQQEIAPRLAAAGVAAELFGPDGAVLARLPPPAGVEPGADGGAPVTVTVTVAAAVIGPGQELTVREAGRTLGTARLTLAPASGALSLPVRINPALRWSLPLTQLAALLLVALAAGFFVDRWLLAPLAALDRATRRVGEGDMGASLLSSRVTEVADLAATFAATRTALAASLERQAELEQQRRMMIAAVAHDLRTPLFALRGYLDGLAGGIADSPEKAARYLRVAREKADALDRLVGDLFAYARTEYLDETPRREPVELAAVLARTAEGVHPQAAAKEVAVAFDGGGQCPTTGDPDLLARVVENLLDNAIRHTPAGGTVRLACRADAAGVEATVSDDGPGIPAADLPRLFDPLFRGEPSRNRRTGGAGLGLSIARRLARAHGGEVTAANRPGGGAVFTLRLPRPADPAATAKPRPETAAPGP
jgi:signal transduction histidine kinase